MEAGLFATRLYRVAAGQKRTEPYKNIRHKTPHVCGRGGPAWFVFRSVGK